MGKAEKKYYLKNRDRILFNLKEERKKNKSVRFCIICKKALPTNSHGLKKYHLGECKKVVNVLRRKEHWLKYKEKYKRKFKTVYQNNKEIYKKKSKIRYKENKERFPEKSKKYNKIVYKTKGWPTMDEDKKEKFREYCRLRDRKTRIEIMNHYGNKCDCCGEKNLEFLCIDHINGGGSKHRKEIKKSGSRFYSWLKKNGYPKEYRILCHNCNFSLGVHGYCPHNKIKE